MTINETSPLLPKAATIQCRPRFAAACVAAVAFAATASTSALADNHWINLTNETSARFLVAPALGASDPEEKDYEWGDVNNNGWVDLVIMRKQPFSTPGRRINVLLMNENGVLVDRTALYATATDVPGDQGFLTPTNDRHSVLSDLLNNGWLDLITAPTYGSGLPKAISHPRFYRNMGDSAGPGTWQGFIFETARTPVYPAPPNNCAVAAGDVTGNGYADLYFVTYGDTQDRLLINDGNGFYTDQTTQRVPGAFSSSAAFGTAGYIADLNGNGLNDIIQSRSGTMRAVYNQGDGFFGSNTTPPTGATYHMTLGDLNNNGRLDLITVDDGTDRYNFNLSTAANGTVNWSSNNMLPESSCGSGNTCSGFGGNVYAVDLNNNGFKDIIVADVDVDISGCSRYSNIYRNNGNVPNVTFTRNIANIPVSNLQGTFDFAVFDITGNGWIDLVAGRCSGTQVWISNPPFDLDFEYPEGRPAVVDAGTPTPVVVQLVAHGGSVTDGSVRLHTSVNGSAWQESVMSTEGSDVYVGELPAAECLDEIAWYVSAEVSSTMFQDPPQAPAVRFSAVAVEDAETIVDHDFDSDDGGFAVVNDPSLTQGAWSYGTPKGSSFFGQIAAPFGDASGDGMAWVTCLGGTAGTCNVNHGPTHLLSPAFDLSDGAAQIVYDRWVFCHNAAQPDREDFLRTYVSNDGGETWTFVHQTSGTANTWETVSFVVNEFVTPTDSVVVRFSIEDVDADSITNAGIDNVRVEAFVCDGPGTPCPADLTGDGSVGVADLLGLLAAWGPNPGHPADLTGDGNVGVADLLALLAAWGPCPR